MSKCPHCGQKMPEDKLLFEDVPRNKIGLPDWLPMEQWLGYVDMRKKSKHPLTEYAQKLELKELTRLRMQGHDPVTVLEQSIRKSYRGLFAPNGISGNHAPPPEDALERERRKEAERRRV